MMEKEEQLMQEKEPANVIPQNQLQEQTETIKKIRKRKIKLLLMKILIPFIIIIMLAGFLFGIINAIGDAIEETIQTLFDGIVDFFDVDYTDGRIKITDDKIDQIIKSIQDLKIDLKDLRLVGDIEEEETEESEQTEEQNETEEEKQQKLQEKQEKALKKYIKAFLEAQVVTQTPYFNVPKQIPVGEAYGTVYIYRATNTNEHIPLTYTKDLSSIPEADVLKYFSIDAATGDLIIATIETSKGTKTTYINGEMSENSIIEPSTMVAFKNIPYKAVVSQYTTTMQFLLYLSIVTQNPEFGLAVCQLIKDSRIDITITDTTTETITTDIYTYQKHTMFLAEMPKVIGYDANNHAIYSETEKEKIQTSTEDQVREETYMETTNIVPKANITYAKTWFSEQTIEYELTINDVPESVYPNMQGVDDEVPTTGPGITEAGFANWSTNKVRNVKEKRKTSGYELHGKDVADRTGEKGDPGAYYDLLGKLKLKDGATFMGLLDSKYKIPNTSKKETPIENLLSGAEWLFELLEKDASSQNLEQVMKYILYKYTGRDYGVTDLDFGMYAAREFSTYSGGIYGGTIQEKVWFALLGMGYSKESVAGAMGNIHYESGSFNPNCIEGGYNEMNGGIGICQWTNDGRGLTGRNADLKAFAESRGKTWKDENIQVEFLKGELTLGGGADGFAKYQLLNTISYYGESIASPDGWKNASDVATATKAFCYSFERPKKSDAQASMATRIQWANYYYNLFKDKQMYEGTDTIESNEYIFPHYLQRNYSHRFGPSTIANAGCGPTSLAMLLAGITGNPSITPITVVENLEEFYPDWHSYFVQNVGVITASMMNNNFLEKYYHVQSTYVSTEAGIQQVENGKVAIGSVKGHMLAIVPVPEEYKNQGYRFYIIDSARGLTGPYRSAAEVRSKPKSYGEFSISYIVEPK